MSKFTTFDHFPARIVGGIIAVLLSLVALTYTNLTSRVSALEDDKKDYTSMTQAIIVQTAVVREQIKYLENETKTLAVNVGTLNDSQQETKAKLENVLNVINQNRKDYLDALKRWEELLERVTRG